MRSFCEQYLAAQLEYRRAGAHRWRGLRGWIPTGANETFVQKVEEVLATRTPIQLAHTPAPSTTAAPRSTGREPSGGNKPSPSPSSNPSGTGGEHSLRHAAAETATTAPPASPVAAPLTAAQSSSTSDARFGWPSPQSVIFVGVLALAFMLMVTWTRPATPPPQTIPAAQSTASQPAVARAPAATSKKRKKPKKKQKKGQGAVKRAPLGMTRLCESPKATSRGPPLAFASGKPSRRLCRMISHGAVMSFQGPHLEVLVLPLLEHTSIAQPLRDLIRNLEWRLNCTDSTASGACISRLGLVGLQDRCEEGVRSDGYSGNGKRQLCLECSCVRAI
jgi:hypothetical protein